MLPVPTPDESTQSEHDLLGISGIFRDQQTSSMLSANNDVEAVFVWINRPNLSVCTCRNYHKETTRLLLWAWYEKQKPLSSLTYEDYLAYKKFLENPSEAWMSHRSQKNSTLHCFEGPLQEKSIKAAFVTISAMLNWLVKKHYLKCHPLEGDNIGELVRHRDILDEKSVARSLSIEEWTKTITTFYQMDPQGADNKAQAKYEQARFILLAYYALGARLNELATHKMNTFYSSKGHWKWYVRGKGNKLANVVLNKQFLQVLIRYREFHQMPSYPAPNDNRPIVLSLYGKTGISARRIHQILKEVLADIAIMLQEEDLALTAKLNAMSTHWLRHTAISHLGEKQTPVYYMQDFARHSDINTTMIYQHTSDEMAIKTVESLVIPTTEEITHSNK